MNQAFVCNLQYQISKARVWALKHNIIRPKWMPEVLKSGRAKKWKVKAIRPI